MDNKLANLLVGIMSDEQINVSENYSGRRMYGETTTAVIDYADYGPSFLTAILKAIASGALTQEDLEEIDISDLRTDNMGLGTVYY